MRETENGARVETLWLLGTLCAGIAVWLALPTERAGWFFLYLSFLVVGLNRRIRRDRALMTMVFLVLVLHQLAALVNAYGFTLPGGEADAYTFNSYAGSKIIDHLSLAIGMRFYVNFLAVFHIFGGDSLLMGEEVSVLAFVLSALVLVRIIDVLGLEKYRVWLMLLFGALPSTVIFSSLTLREPFELLFFMLGVYGGLRAFLKPVWWAAPVCVGSLLAAGLFQQLLMLYAFCAAAILFLVPAIAGRSRTRVMVAISGLVAVVLAGILALGLIATPRGDNYLAMIHRHPIRELMKYRHEVNSGRPRTEFETGLNDSSAAGFVSSAALVYLNFLFAPFPWQIQGLMDAYACLESALRAVLLAGSFAAFYLAVGGQRRQLLKLLLLYGSMTAMWALGTTNYGQAIRHHVLTNWILVLAGGPLLVAWGRDLWARMTGRTMTKEPEHAHS